VTEISLVLSPNSSSVPSSKLPFPIASGHTTHTIFYALFPERITHQHILFLHQLFLFLSIALSRVVPVLISAFSPAPKNLSPQEHRQLAERLTGLSMIADREASMMMNTVLHSITSPTEDHEDVSSLARPRPYEMPSQIPSAPGASTSDPSFYTDVSSLTGPFFVVVSLYCLPDAKYIETSRTRLLQMLTKEIEDLIIEANIKQDEGPLRSIWESAVRRARAQEPHALDAPELGGKKSISWEDELVRTKEVVGDEGRSLPAPVSRSPTIGLTSSLPSLTRRSYSAGGRTRRISC
jgi:hypothetical protein